jgi:uncharacterized protein (UPF0305 family)
MAADKDTMKKELETALSYFEMSCKESIVSPARFCHPFYRAYFAIAFLEAKDNEVQRYLAEAEDAIGGSESRGELLAAVENLVEALKESQRLKDRPIQEVASKLNTYRLYCEKAAEHMKSAEDRAPDAVKLMRVVNLILEERIQATITEIQEQAKRICQITHGSGTEYEAPGTKIYRAA